MVSSPARKVSLIALACKVLQLTTSIEKDSCEIDNGFYEMFKQVGFLGFLKIMLKRVFFFRFYEMLKQVGSFGFMNC